MLRRHLLFASALVPLAAAAQAPAARTITWEELVPKDWDPMKDFRDLNMGTLTDADPRAAQMLKKMREAWDNAPVNNAIDNQRVRLPGYVVPLDDSSAGLKEFLLVPYFGACIHTPPPPSNQIVHVLADKPLPLKSMDVVWASGTLRTLRTDSYMGASGYRLQQVAVDAYLPPKK